MAKPGCEWCGPPRPRFREWQVALAQEARERPLGPTTQAIRGREPPRSRRPDESRWNKNAARISLYECPKKKASTIKKPHAKLGPARPCSLSRRTRNDCSLGG